VSKRYFGTDGIRGCTGQHPITPEFMLKLGWAAGRVFARDGHCKVIIGKDTRISGYMFESALEAGLAAAGVDIRLLGPMPTPAIAYLTRTFHASAGIVISASHNPYYDNGIKFFSSSGSKLPDEVELAIEEELDKPLVTVDSSRIGKAARIEDAGGRYIEFCKSTIPMRVSLSGMKIIVDCANGATYQVAPRVLKELDAEVIATGNQPDGMNINKDCGSTKPELLQKMVLEQGAHVGVSLDGDGDRVIMVDEKGELVDGDELLFVIAQSRLQDENLSGTVVGTVMSNLGLEHALNELGIDFKRAPVGDRYVMEMLQAGGWTLGGESSGHIICLDRTTTGDGIVSALQVLAAMAKSGRSLSELKSGMTKYPQVLLNVQLPVEFEPAERRALADSPQLQAAVAEAETALADRGRILLRASGTEPLFRVMVEGQDASQVSELANRLAAVVTETVGGSKSAINQ
jgi:phosphoglucosamine mutase